MRLRVFTAFSGYDSQCLALELAGIDYELIGWSEIDKNAIKAHNALFPQYADRNYGDISKIDWNQVPEFDFFTYSFPCTDISLAGQQKGFARGSGTRSSLLWECERAIEKKRPKYLLLENVAALVSGDNIKGFNEWQLILERLGYRNYTKVLNSREYGYPEPVPQNRERVFVVSILDDNEGFYFPMPKRLKKKLEDILEPEDEVDKSYYLTDAQLAKIKSELVTDVRGGANGYKD